MKWFSPDFITVPMFAFWVFFPPRYSKTKGLNEQVEDRKPKDLNGQAEDRKPQDLNGQSKNRMETLPENMEQKPRKETRVVDSLEKNTTMGEEEDLSSFQDSDPRRRRRVSFSSSAE